MKNKLVFAGLLVITVSLTIMSSCQSEGEQMFNRYFTSGKMLYQAHCENCHGLNGEGLSMLIPPLHDAPYLKTNLNHLPCFVKNGLTGNITVAGNQYNGNMPAQNNLSSIEVAEILTYVTNSFGSKAGLIDAGKVNTALNNCN